MHLPKHERFWLRELLELNFIGFFLLRDTTVLLITLRRAMRPKVLLLLLSKFTLRFSLHRISPQLSADWNQMLKRELHSRRKDFVEWTGMLSCLCGH